MMITEITKEVMEGLKPGDVVSFKPGGEVKITERYSQFSSRFPHGFRFEGYGLQWYSYSDKGKYFSADPSPLDIIAVEKALPEIPEGFIPWEGGECPVEPNAIVDYIISDGNRQDGYTPAGNLRWNHIGSYGDIIAYRPVTPLQQGEIWCVVRMIETGPYHHCFCTKETAIKYAKNADKQNMLLAIFNPFKTGGVWKEGDGLELLKDK